MSKQTKSVKRRLLDDLNAEENHSKKSKQNVSSNRNEMISYSEKNNNIGDNAVPGTSGLQQNKKAKILKVRK